MVVLPAANALDGPIARLVVHRHIDGKGTSNLLGRLVARNRTQLNGARLPITLACKRATLFLR